VRYFTGLGMNQCPKWVKRMGEARNWFVGGLVVEVPFWLLLSGAAVVGAVFGLIALWIEYRHYRDR